MSMFSFCQLDTVTKRESLSECAFKHHVQSHRTGIMAWYPSELAPRTSGGLWTLSSVTKEPSKTIAETIETDNPERTFSGMFRNEPQEKMHKLHLDVQIRRVWDCSFPISTRRY
jgi:hypothetical protein